MGVYTSLWLFLLNPIVYLSLLLLISSTGKNEVTAAASASDKKSDYDRCFKMLDHAPGCDESASSSSPHKCYTVRSEPNTTVKGKDKHLPFGCHKAPCSIQNEAFWLGMYPREDFEHFLVKPPTDYFEESQETPKRHKKDKEESGFYDKREIRRAYITALSGYWKQFKKMYTNEGKQMPDDVVERAIVPDYISQAVLPTVPSKDSKQPASKIVLRIDKGDTVVPLICDPRAYLVCDHSYEGTDAFRTPGTGIDDEDYELTGQCNCHPLYSKEGQHSQREVPPATDGESRAPLPVVNNCLGRPNVPCEFGRWVTKDGAHFLYNLTKAPPPGYDGKAVGYTTVLPPSEDPLATYLTPEDFHDQVENDSIDKHIVWVSSNSRCIPEASCEFFPNTTIMERFRRGELWQGFGYHPIIFNMMLQSATKICQCKDREGYQYSGMHDCITK